MKVYCVLKEESNRGEYEDHEHNTYLLCVAGSSEKAKEYIANYDIEKSGLDHGYFDNIKVLIDNNYENKRKIICHEDKDGYVFARYSDEEINESIKTLLNNEYMLDDSIFYGSDIWDVILYIEEFELI